MKKIAALVISLLFVVSAAVSPVVAAGGKNQHEKGAPTAPGPGGDAQGNQAD